MGIGFPEEGDARFVHPSHAVVAISLPRAGYLRVSSELVLPRPSPVSSSSGEYNVQVVSFFLSAFRLEMVVFTARWSLANARYTRIFRESEPPCCRM